MKNVIFFFFIAINLAPVYGNAQILNKLKSRVQQAIERKIEQKVEEKVEREVDKAAGKAVDNAWDAVFGADAATYNGSSIDTAKLKQLSSVFNQANVPTESQYSFDIKTTLEMKFIPKSGKLEPPTMLEMYFKQGTKYTGSTYKADPSKNQGEMMFMIADYQNKALVVLMGNNEQKYRTVMSMDPALFNLSNQVETQQENIDWNNVTEWRGYKKLGKRTIMGYSCDGYTITNEIGKSEVWITRDELFGMENFFNSANMGVQSKFPKDIPYGMLVEMHSEDLKTGDKSIFSLKEVKKGINQVYKMSDYPKIGQE
ncbi:MAG: DUF4412 domain-containing protein [Saprospiraceae bacterium]